MFKKICSVLLILVLAFGLMASTVFASVRVHGYTTKKGTYVAPYHRTSPDNSKSNNYSSKGNINPYTGKKGTK